MIFILFFIYIFFIFLAEKLFGVALKQVGGGDISGNNGDFITLGIFLRDLKKKQKNKKSHIEVEIKLRRDIPYRKIIDWIKSKKYTEEITTNRIWSNFNIIETEHASKISWHSKKRLSKFDTDLGKITVAAEQQLCNADLPCDLYSHQPTIVRHKKRISAKINKNWRVDCTWINGSEVPEIEVEYISSNFWRAPDVIHEVEKFLQLNIYA